MDARTGAVIWNVVGANKPGEYYTSAPVVWDGLIYIGNSGGDYGAISHVRAFDANRAASCGTSIPWRPPGRWRGPGRRIRRGSRQVAA